MSVGGLYPLGKSLWQAGKILLDDDIDDLGHFTYFGRNHYYHGKYAPDHPSPLHHWQAAGGLMFLGEILGYLDIAKEMTVEEEAPQEQSVPLQMVFRS